MDRLTEIVEQNAEGRTEAEALADRLMPMTERQLLSLSTERLEKLVADAKHARLMMDYRDDAWASTVHGSRQASELERLARNARMALECKRSLQTAEAHAKTFSAITDALFGGEAA